MIDMQFEFVRQLSSDSTNIVIGTVRDKAAAEAKVAKELEGRKNIHILETDMTDYNGLKVLSTPSSIPFPSLSARNKN